MNRIIIALILLTAGAARGQTYTANTCWDLKEGHAIPCFSKVEDVQDPGAKPWPGDCIDDNYYLVPCPKYPETIPYVDPRNLPTIRIEATGKWQIASCLESEAQKYLDEGWEPYSVTLESMEKGEMYPMGPLTYSRRTFRYWFRRMER